MSIDFSYDEQLYFFVYFGSKRKDKYSKQKS